ncbi:MAG: epoxyqueuosine reductase [Deltaproteobacteria bacterium]|nr:epoxyqueuosine reductase [Deltaproteobacteria bacterium]
MVKEDIRSYAMGLGIDDAGFASAADYRSPRSPRLETIFPGVRSLIVLAYREIESCESPDMHIALNGRLDLMEFSRGCNYRLARFLEREYGARAMTVPVSYPMDMGRTTKGTVGQVSLRHAAVTAGLGILGRHNLVVHPRFGSRVIFSAVLTDLDLPSDRPLEARLCMDCGLCVEGCPGRALDEAGRTDVMKCIRNSQPYGLSGAIGFWTRHADAAPEERKAMFRDDFFWRMYQAGHIGPQYFCFNCISACPVGRNGS